MRLRTILAAGVLTLTAGAFAQTVELPSGTLTPQGNVEVPFLIKVNAPSVFGNAAVRLRINTQFFDLRYANSGGTVRLLSERPATPATQSQTGFGAAPAGVTGTPALVVYPVSGQPGVYDISFGITAGSNFVNGPTVNNLLNAGNGQPFTLIVKTNAIGVGNSASIALAPTGSVVGVETSPGSGQNINRTLSLVNGTGTFTVVPEPGTIAAVVTGLAGMVAIRRRRA